MFPGGPCRHADGAVNKTRNIGLETSAVVMTLCRSFRPVESSSSSMSHPFGNVTDASPLLRKKESAHDDQTTRRPVR